MPRISMREMLEAGAHFGHQTKRWNPKMKPYIYGARNGIYIVNLGKTVQLFERACAFLSQAVTGGGSVLFVGTKRQAQDIVTEEAERGGQFYVTHRWLGGTLTNWRTMRKSIDRLKSLERAAIDGTYEKLTKKEIRSRERDREKLKRNLDGIKNMERLPAALFVVDPGKEALAVREANILGIPVVAVVDTNTSPDGIDYIIPGNDDAIRSIRLFCSTIAEACLEGSKGREERVGRRNAESKPYSTEVQTRGSLPPEMEGREAE